MAKKPKILNQNGLNDVEQAFVNRYLLNGNNGKQAMLSIKPNFNENSATREAFRYLQKPNVIKYINQKRQEILEAEDIQLSYIVSNLKNIVEEVNDERTERDPLTGRITSKPDRKAKTQALELLAKMGGFTDKKVPIHIETTGEVKISFGDWEPESTKPIDSVDVDFTDITDVNEDK